MQNVLTAPVRTVIVRLLLLFRTFTAWTYNRKMFKVIVNEEYISSAPWLVWSVMYIYQRVKLSPTLHKYHQILKTLFSPSATSTNNKPSNISKTFWLDKRWFGCGSVAQWVKQRTNTASEEGFNFYWHDEHFNSQHSHGIVGYLDKGQNGENGTSM